MSSSNIPGTTQRSPPGRLVLQACKTDDISLLIEAVSLASSTPSNSIVPELLSQAVRQSIRHNATKVLIYTLDHGAEVPLYSNLALDIEGESPSTEMLEVLLTNGWDINSRIIGSQPFLWGVVLIGDGDLVQWCLNHGATAIPRDLGLESDEDRWKDEIGCPAVLEFAARTCTVATFETLRLSGAPLGRRTLHFAAKAAVKVREEGEERQNISDKERAKLHSERINMVVYIVEELGVDPNALDQPVGWMLGNHWGTPLCYVTQSNPNWDSSEVVLYLLKKGANPFQKTEPYAGGGHSAFDLAQRARNQQFIDIVNNWKEKSEKR